MTDPAPPRNYRFTRLDDVEDIEKYRPGGYHPVNLYDILNGKYKIVHKLGHGGFATVWLARDLQENRYVALKILIADAPNKDLQFLTYLQNHSADHPILASLQAVFTICGSNGSHECLVFNVLGPSLERMTLSKHQLSGPMIRNAARQIAQGVSHLHSTGICHGGNHSPPPDKGPD